MEKKRTRLFRAINNALKLLSQGKNIDIGENEARLSQITVIKKSKHIDR